MRATIACVAIIFASSLLFARFSYQSFSSLSLLLVSPRHVFFRWRTYPLRFVRVVLREGARFGGKFNCVVTPPPSFCFGTVQCRLQCDVVQMAHHVLQIVILTGLL